jgi:hypothetical protein
MGSLGTDSEVTEWVDGVAGAGIDMSVEAVASETM